MAPLNLKMTGVPSLSHRPFNAQRQASLSRQVNQLPHLGLPYPCSDAVVSWSHLFTKQQLLIQKRLALKQPGLSREDGLSCSAALQFVPKGKLPLILRLHKTAFLMKSTRQRPCLETPKQVSKNVQRAVLLTSYWGSTRKSWHLIPTSFLVFTSL